jgi:hypothetical protein
LIGASLCAAFIGERAPSRLIDDPQSGGPGDLDYTWTIVFLDRPH